MEALVECVAGSLEDQIRAQVPFSSESKSFMPADAISCAKTAFGFSNCTVSAFGKTYRVDGLAKKAKLVNTWGGSRGGGRKPTTSTPVDRSKPLYLESWMWEAASRQGEARAVLRAILERELKK